MKYYCGIGSRQAPESILKLMAEYADHLFHMQYCLRSGGAKGADKAFESGVPPEALSIYKEIFYQDESTVWTYNELMKHFPSDRDKNTFDNWKPFIKGLLRRNMKQVLGANGDSPVEFVVCWAKSLDYSDSSAGGTGWAIRCALAHDIPVYNLFSNDQRKAFEERIKYD